MFESTATLALERFAAFMESLLVPRNQTWHRLKASVPELNESQNVKEWFDIANTRIMQLRNNPVARYYSQKQEALKSLGAFGNETLFLDEVATGGYRYKHCHLGKTWIDVDHLGIVDSVYYEFDLTADNAIKKWGKGAPRAAHDQYQRDPTATTTYLHVVRPRKLHDPERRDALAMPYESLILSTTDYELVDEGGFEELPYLHSRYTVNPAEMYGRGPAELLLPDIETLQEQEKTFQRAGHKVADPPLLVQSDGPLGRGARRVVLKPGGLTYGGLDANGRPTVVPLITGANLPLTESMMLQKREQISAGFLNSLFLMLVENREMTATEIMERAKEKGQLLTPTTGRQESEALGPQIIREVHIAQRQGLLPPLPPELEEAGGEFEIVYENEAARLQRADEALAIEKTTQWAVGVAAAGGDPTVVEVIDWHESLRVLGEINGMPAKLMKDKETVKKALAAQAEAAEQQRALEMGTQVAAMAKDAKAAGIDLDAAAPASDVG